MGTYEVLMIIALVGLCTPVAFLLVFLGCAAVESWRRLHPPKWHPTYRKH